MNIQDELTQAIAEAAKNVISKKESLKDYKPTRGGKNQDDFIDLHTIDDKEDPEKEKQVEEKDEVEEGNEFTKAAAKAKLAGENEFEFKGKTYPVEIEKDAAEKILGKKEEVEIEEGFYYDGMSAKDKKRLNDIYKKMDKNEKQTQAAIKKGDAKTVDKLGDEYHKLRMQVVNFYNEDVELKEFNRLKPDDVRDAYGTIQLKYRSSADIRNAEDKLKKAGINVRKSGDTLEVDSDSPAFKKAKITSSFDSSKREKAIMKVLGESAEKKTEELEENRAIVYNPRMIRAFIKQVEKKFPKYKGEIQQIEKDEIVFPNDDKLRDFFRGAKEVKFVLRDSVEIEEAIDPRKFVLGGNTKATKRDVDAILSKIFINAKLAKQVEDSKAYKAGYKSKGEGKNPYKKDTADFHLYILGQQSAQSE